jgi:ferrochelatase
MEIYITMLADLLEEALSEELIRPTKPLVVFTAHSLPVADIEADPAYVDQLRETAVAVAARCRLGDADGFEALEGIEPFGGHSGAMPWLLAFQSKGRRGGEWIGPDLDDVIDAAVTAGFGSVVISPIGFAMDHMETVYDLDVCAADRALSADIEFARAIAPNDEKKMIETLRDAVNAVL